MSYAQDQEMNRLEDCRPPCIDKPMTALTGVEHAQCQLWFNAVMSSRLIYSQREAVIRGKRSRSVGP